MRLYYIFYIIDLLPYYTIRLTGHLGLHIPAAESFSVSLNQMTGFKKEMFFAYLLELYRLVFAVYITYVLRSLSVARVQDLILELKF